MPFIGWRCFTGGAHKAETNAPANLVDDIDPGFEWQLAREGELTPVWHHLHRNNLATGNRSGRDDYERFNTKALWLQLPKNCWPVALTGPGPWVQGGFCPAAGVEQFPRNVRNIPPAVGVPSVASQCVWINSAALAG